MHCSLDSGVWQTQDLSGGFQMTPSFLVPTACQSIFLVRMHGFSFPLQRLLNRIRFPVSLI